VVELQPGLWHWQAPHPDWEPGELWPQLVSSYAIDDGRRLLLFDPLAVPEELIALAADREPVVVLTAPWHERDTRLLVERLGAAVFAPPADTPADLARKYGVAVEQVADGSPDLKWLSAAPDVEAHSYHAGDRLPFGIHAFPGRVNNDMVLWIEPRRAVVAGDALGDWGRGLQIPLEGLTLGVTHEQVRDGLLPLLERPVELVLPAHGVPVARAELERALA